MSTFIKKIELSGIVCKKKKDSIWIIQDNSLCLSSDECKVGCGTCSYAKNKKKVKICVENVSKVECGDRISISTIQLNEAVAAMIAFGLPILLMLLSLFLWYMFTSVDLDSPKVTLSTLLSFIMGFVIVKEIDTILRKRFPVKDDDIKISKMEKIK
ncbi:MAG: SoxR reducing system RseC family protein [Chitinispirillaceae bacterium]|nr:SoxR reducing system RseC family protein [Chitinispirillaceae bacterium]